ncbi:MAG: winged helix-turn-helix domain-containing protein [Gemmatimonadota bacterium]
MRAVIVDDEAPARRRLRGVLQQINTVTRIDECASGRDAVELLKRGAPDLVFLDIQMPDLDGFAVAAAASDTRPPAIIFVTAYDEHAVRAFEIQAFDYLLKPFDDERVVATVRRAEDFLEWIRREASAAGGGSAGPVLRGFGDVTVDFATHQVKRGSRAMDLRPKEYALLVALLKRGGRVASRLELLREVWGYAEDVMSRTVDTHIAMLRRKLEADAAHPRHIVTVRTFGYRIER